MLGVASSLGCKASGEVEPSVPRLFPPNEIFEVVKGVTRHTKGVW